VVAELYVGRTLRNNHREKLENEAKSVRSTGGFVGRNFGQDQLLKGIRDIVIIEAVAMIIRKKSVSKGQ